MARATAMDYARDSVSLGATGIARAAAGLQAFVAGRRVGEEWAARGAGGLAAEARGIVEREDAKALALASVAAAGAAWTLLRKKELIALALVGFLVGSGLAERAWTRLRGSAS